MKKLGIIVAVLALVSAVFWWIIGANWRALLSDPPSHANILFWSQDQRNVGFRMMDQMPFIIKSNKIETGKTPRELVVGEPLTFDIDVEQDFIAQNRAAAIVLHNGKIRYEKYGLGLSEDDKWTSFSVAKSFLSTLAGMAIKDGYIGSLDDEISLYIKALEGTEYGKATVEDVLTMRSGMQWNEDYDDPLSDVSVFRTHRSQTEGVSDLVDYMKDLPRAHPRGEVWHYSTGESNLVGVLIVEATGKSLAKFLSEKIWIPFGMQQEASWLKGKDGYELGGCCIQAAPRDFARFGQFILEGGRINGLPVLPEGWLDKATSKQADVNRVGEGYGYKWWIYDDGTFTAGGIFGQGIFIDPARDLVIAVNGNWPKATGKELNAARLGFYHAVQRAIDAENTP